MKIRYSNNLLCRPLISLILKKHKIIVIIDNNKQAIINNVETIDKIQLKNMNNGFEIQHQPESINNEKIINKNINNELKDIKLLYENLLNRSCDEFKEK